MILLKAKKLPIIFSVYLIQLLLLQLQLPPDSVSPRNITFQLNALVIILQKQMIISADSQFSLVKLRNFIATYFLMKYNFDNKPTIIPVAVCPIHHQQSSKMCPHDPMIWLQLTILQNIIIDIFLMISCQLLLL